MKLPLSWLAEWVPVPGDPRVLAERLTMAGFEVESVTGMDDPIFEVSITPNRGDAMSILGLAREVAAFSGQALRHPESPPAPVLLRERSDARVEAPAAAPRLLTRIIKGVDNRAASPAWLQERLQRCGLRSISPVVDVTNFVLLELGQPMHAYDLGKLRGALCVRAARAGESMTLLDGRVISLAPDVTVIADDGGPIGLAGVMGGAGTAITPGASDVLLEAAFFAPEAIAGRARRYGQQTDASQRFERGVDPQLQERAIERATGLILQVAGGQAGPVSVLQSPSSASVRLPIRLRRERLHRIMGSAPTDEKVESVLQGLGLRLQRDGAGWQVQPPSYRFDIAIEPDLIEEVIRGVGYENIPEIDRPLRQRVRPISETLVEERKLLETLISQGYQEVINFAFVDPGLQARLFADMPALRLSNPIASDLAVLRVSLWPGLLRVALENQHRQQPRIRLCELANVFLAGEEPRRIAAVVLGSRWPEQWGLPREDVDFFDLKGDVAALLALSGEPQQYSFERGELPCLHPGRAARVLRATSQGATEAIGWLGELHPALVREWQFTYAPILFELDVGAITKSRLPAFEPVSRFPQLRRDISFTIPLATPLSAVRERASVAASSLLRDLRIFDLYQGPGIETGRKSVALGLILQDNYRTLTVDEADEVVARVSADLRATLDARIRE